ncbi:MAG: HpcH/HpaI aldolase/citrate lyase family protein [Candidatus Microsaccharimonas sp.]
MGNSLFHPTLYTPATTPIAKQLAIVNNEGVEGARRVVLCTEDSIREDDVNLAVDTLRSVLQQMKRDTAVTSYVRVRNPEVMRRLLEMPGVEKLQGFVVPKADPDHFREYAEQIVGSDFTVMPILESSRMFDANYRTSLFNGLRDYAEMIECLRIGVNDLMGYLGIRRSTDGFTVYDTPVGVLVNQIINEFRGVGGFTITAPVFECYDEKYDALLVKEVQQHILNGLYGQTVIHPRHLGIIRDLYAVDERDLESARGILGYSSAVVGLNGRMDEYTTHWRWATTILERFELFGVAPDKESVAKLTAIA